MGEGLELRAIAAAILGGAALTGGRGSIVGAVVGAITLSVIQNIINLSGINPAWETTIVGRDPARRGDRRPAGDARRDPDAGPAHANRGRRDRVRAIVARA